MNKGRGKIHIFYFQSFKIFSFIDYFQNYLAFKLVCSYEMAFILYKHYKVVE